MEEPNGLDAIYETISNVIFGVFYGHPEIL